MFHVALESLLDVHSQEKRVGRGGNVYVALESLLDIHPQAWWVGGQMFHAMMESLLEVSSQRRGKSVHVALGSLLQSAQRNVASLLLRSHLS